MIGMNGKRESRKSLVAARLDDDDDDEMQTDATRNWTWVAVSISYKLLCMSKKQLSQTGYAYHKREDKSSPKILL